MQLNTRTTYTKNEAILIMLGLGSEYNSDFIDSEAEDPFEFIFDRNALDLIHERFMSDLIFEGWEKEEANEVAQDYINYLAKEARYYLIELDDELAKRNESQLRVLENGEITVKSFNEWFETIQPKYKPESTFQDEIDPIKIPIELKEIIKKGGGLVSLYVTFANLLEAYAKSYPSKYVNKDGLIIQEALANQLYNLGVEFNEANQSISIGQGFELMRKRVGIAFKARQIHLKKT